MANRFHNKWHRNNHHTYQKNDDPDGGHDPIASPALPFRGDFVLSGALSASAPLSGAAGVFFSNNTALSALGGTTALYTSASAITIATYNPTTAHTGPSSGTALYTFAPAICATGPFPVIDTIRSYGPKALIVDGYSDFKWPLFATEIYTYKLNANSLNIPTIFFDTISATNAIFNSISAINSTVINITAINYSVTTLSANSITATSAQFNDISTIVKSSVAVRNNSITVVPNTWTLCPLESAVPTGDPFTYYRPNGTIRPLKSGIYMCELNATAHVLSGTPLGIVAGVSTSNDISAVGLDPDVAGPFTGTWITNNGVTYTNSQGEAGVMFQGTTLISVNGATDEIGMYVYNVNGNSIIDYARLRVVHLGKLTLP